jgi:hypothetical protein
MAGVEHELRLDIGSPGAPEYLLPDIFGVGEDHGNELARPVGLIALWRPGRAAAICRWIVGPCLRLLLWQLITAQQRQECARVYSEKEADDSADPADPANPDRHAGAAPVLDVFALAIANPSHGGGPVCLLGSVVEHHIKEKAGAGILLAIKPDQAKGDPANHRQLPS